MAEVKERSNVDLNRVRDIVLQSQNAGEDKPAALDRQLFVDTTGQLLEGSRALGTDRALSVVPQAVFASSKARDRDIIARHLPTGTREIVDSGGTTCWVYSFMNEFREKFVMVLYHDGNYYQVKLMLPELEKKWQNPHTGHLFEDSRICLGHAYGSGAPSIQDAYAKSVLWSNGISLALRGFPFPFSANQ